MKRLKWVFSSALICLALVVALIASCGDEDDDDDNVSEEVWEDSVSGLMWQNDSICCYEWSDAKSYCDNLNWGGYDDWHLPSISELRSLVRGCEFIETGGACGVTDDCTNYNDCFNNLCYSCDNEGEPEQNGYYYPEELKGGGYSFWSSTRVVGHWDKEYNAAWAIDFLEASIDDEDIGYNLGVRCVR